MNTESKIWLSSPHMGGNEIDFIKEALQTNWVAPMGSNIEGFEMDLKNFLGEKSNHVTCLNSGTSAIHLALILAGVVKGDEVICQSMTFSASANPICYQGATPVFIDSEPETWNMCPIHLEHAIKARIANGVKPKVIIVVHLYGMPAKMDKIIEIASKFNILIIEDAAEALGSIYKNKKCGTLTQFGILSFNGNKMITTSSGGALLSKNSKDKERAIYLATQARENEVFYQHSEIGYNYRMSNVNAGIGRGQMIVLDKHMALRRANNLFYQNLFKDIKGVSVFIEPNKDIVSNHWLTCIIFSKEVEITPNSLRLSLEKHFIETRPLWKPLHLQPVFNKYPYYGGSVSENLFLNGLCLPSGSNLTEKERKRIQLAILDAFKK